MPLAWTIGAPTAANAASCASSIGPGALATGTGPTGLDGYHAAWYGQSGYATLCPSTQSTVTFAYLNTGSRGWLAGQAYLGTWAPEPGQDRASVLGGDGTLGTPNTSWPRPERVAAPTTPYVGPGQVAWFTFLVQAPAKAGVYRLGVRPVIEGVQWLEDQGVYVSVTVLNPDGTAPAPAPVAAPTPAVAGFSSITVLASWYGPGFYGNTTACGQVYSSAILGVAHRTLPCGTSVTLSYGGRTVRVPVIDRGPYVYDREFDLSYATKTALGCPDLCRVVWYH